MLNILLPALLTLALNISASFYAYAAGPCTPESAAQPAIEQAQSATAASVAPLMRPSHAAFVDTINQMGCGATYDELVGHMRRVYSREKRNLSPFKDDGAEGTDELLSIFMYTGHCYEAINTKTESGNAQEIQPYIDMARIALGRLPPYKGLVVRGSALKGIAAEHQPGQLIQYRNFISTSKSITYLEKKYQLMIHSETGRHVASYSAYRGEEEVLFPPGVTFKVQDRVKPDQTSLPEVRTWTKAMRINRWNPDPHYPDVEMIILREVKDPEGTPKLLPK